MGFVFFQLERNEKSVRNFTTWQGTICAEVNNCDKMQIFPLQRQKGML